MSTAAPVYRSTVPRPAGVASGSTSTFKDLLEQVRSAGLLERRVGFYWAVFGTLVGVGALAWLASAFLGHTWYALIPAAVLGAVFTQSACRTRGG
jgi:hypothetical protein